MAAVQIGRASVLINMPPELKAAIATETRRRGTNMNDLVVGLIAQHYGVPFSPSGRRSDPGFSQGKVILRMSGELKRRIQLDAFFSDSNMTDTIVRGLAQEFALELSLPTPHRTTPFGGGRRRAA